MATYNDWKKEAEKEAKRYSDTIKQNNQYLIDQLNQSKNNTLNQLQEQQNNAIYNLNSNKASINQTATDNAKQLNVARLMALKSNQSAMNRAGLGSQGIVGSQVNSINNEYGTNLTNVLNQQTNDLRNLEKEKNNTLLTYNTNRLNLENEYGDSLANLQSQINDKALNQYNNVYNQVLNMRQQEYENKQAELARQEAIRQYNEQMAYQKQQDAIANAQKWAQINASKQKNNSGVIDFSDNNKTINFTSDNNVNLNDLSNLYSTYNWSSHINKELFRWANNGYGTVNETSKNKIIDSVEKGLKNKDMTEEEANIILYALGIR